MHNRITIKSTNFFILTETSSQLIQSENINQNSAEEASSSRATSIDESRSEASRTRRLMSHSTIQENDLDNSVLNSPQQYIDLDEMSDNDSDEDQLFEEYLRENAEAARSQARMFDDELPMNHTYLGSNMDAVRGTNYYEPGKVYDIPVWPHHSMVFPGEILPMIMIAESIFARTPESNEGLTFGIYFADEIENDKAYGVICQVFEKGLDEHGHITVKSKAHQRFIIINNEDGLGIMRNHSYYAKVRILPEFVLPDPFNLNMSNPMMKFNQSPCQSNRVKNILSFSNRWPKFVYDQYSIAAINEKVERYLAMLNISSPDDPVLKSFWLARNVPLNQAERLKIFASNCVNKRMIIIGESLNFVSLLIGKVFFFG